MNKMREKLAQEFLNALKEERLPWYACWKTSLPENALTGKRYRGVNALMLSYHSQAQGFSDSRWCTYLQAQKQGWQVRRGEKGCPVEYWAYFDRVQKKMLPWPEAAKLSKEDPVYFESSCILTSKLSIVFNGDQIEGIPKQILAEANIQGIRAQRDTLLRNMELNYRETGNQAYYSPANDTVTLPPENCFFDTYSYVGTFLHECGHATGHASRLNRDMSGTFGSDSYAREELRAEMASAFAAQALDLKLTDKQLRTHTDLHKAYIQAWAAQLKDSPRELFSAIRDAEKISDYLIEKGEFIQALGIGKQPPAANALDSLVKQAQKQIAAEAPSAPKLEQAAALER